MEDFLIKSILCQIVLFGLYSLFLEREKMQDPKNIRNHFNIGFTPTTISTKMKWEKTLKNMQETK